jgi:hypothetical protein
LFFYFYFFLRIPPRNSQYKIIFFAVLPEILLILFSEILELIIKPYSFLLQAYKSSTILKLIAGKPLGPLIYALLRHSEQTRNNRLIFGQIRIFCEWTPCIFKNCFLICRVNYNIDENWQYGGLNGFDKFWWSHLKRIFQKLSIVNVCTLIA